MCAVCICRPLKLEQFYGFVGPAEYSAYSNWMENAFTQFIRIVSIGMLFVSPEAQSPCQ